MSVLAALNRAYERLARNGRVPSLGYAQERISWLVLLSAEGKPAALPVDLTLEVRGKRRPRLLAVPEPVKRTSGIAPNFLWDKTAYSLGVTAGDDRRLAEAHAAFVELHREALRDENDPGLQALLRFLDWWEPKRFEALGWPAEMKDQNLVFGLDSDQQGADIVALHDRPAARAVWARISAGGEGGTAICLVTGQKGPVARLHPSIRGVWGAQSSGASLVSFNLDAFTSYGHEQGENAPVSKAAAFAYGTALNHFLQAESRHRIQIADATAVFWAEAPDAQSAQDAEAIFGGWFGDLAIDEAGQAARVREVLETIRQGQPLENAVPELAEGVRFHIVALSPNAARLSVRFHVENDFRVLVRNLARHARAMRIDPPPREGFAPVWRCLRETAVQRKAENVPPLLAGEWLRAILAGTPYPLTLLSALLVRLRADHDVNANRAAMLRAVLVTRGREVPVSLDPECRDPGYLLGRLFAAYEYAQIQALGRGVNATIRDKYYGTASATPRAVFPLLQRGCTHHLARLRKDRPRTAAWLDGVIAAIYEMAAPEELFVPTLTAQRQAMFAIGYYHQKNDFYRGRAEAAEEQTEEASA